MSWIEDELRIALRRREPPEGFAERVIARTRPPRRQWRRHQWQWMAAAAAILLIFGAGLFRFEQIRAERRNAEAAKQQLIFALEIAAGKLQTVKYRISNRASSQTLEVPASDEKGNDRRL